MLKRTPYKVDKDIWESAIRSIPNIDFRLELNQPSGRFFYDPWVIKEEFKNTHWEKILDSIPENKGEARLIKLEPETCYRSHADIDDRWHLSLSGERSYLIDLENEKICSTKLDCNWYTIDAGLRHSAANFGSKPRVQLVVRKLLNQCNLINPKSISITLKKIIEDRRYVFDDIVSPCLNKLSKQNKMTDFAYEEFEVRMKIEESELANFQETIQSHFNIKIL